MPKLYATHYTEAIVHHDPNFYYNQIKDITWSQGDTKFLWKIFNPVKC